MVDKDRVFPRITTWARWLEEWRRPGLTEAAAVGLLMSICYVVFRGPERATATRMLREINETYHASNPAVSAAAGQMMRSVAA